MSPEGIQVEPCSVDLPDQNPAGSTGSTPWLDAETIESLVTEYVGGTTAEVLGRRYGLAEGSVLRPVRDAGERVRHPRISESETARLVELYEVGL